MNTRAAGLLGVAIAWVVLFAVALSTGLDNIFVKGDHRMWWRIAFWGALAVGGAMLAPRLRAISVVRTAAYGAVVGYIGGVLAHWCWLFAMTAPMERLSHGLEHDWWMMSLMPFGFPIVAGTPVWGMLMALGGRATARRQQARQS